MFKNLGLVPKLLLGILAGVLVGNFLPEIIVQSLITLASLFSTFLKFMIPFIIVGFVIGGIADLSSNAGRLLGLTTGIAYGSTILIGLLAFAAASIIFPSFITSSNVAIGDPEAGMLSPFFTIPLKPMFDVTSAIVFSFIMGIGISVLRGQGNGKVLYEAAHDFQTIIHKVLEKIIIPFLPIYIAGTFANITYAGQIIGIMKTFSIVFILAIALHFVGISIQYLLAGTISKKNPLHLLKNQAPGYLTAFGTQSSAATIPVNVGCAKQNGVSKQIREFVVPLCATIHLSGSITSLTCFSMGILMMNNMDHSLATMLPFLLMVGVAMVAAPGAPGGAVMAALPFLPMIGIESEGALASLLVALYITQDSFGTAANVSGDNAIAVVVDTINKKWTKAA